jgi:flagellar assembly factor FliW
MDMSMVSSQSAGQTREMNTTSLGRIQYTERQRFKCPSGLIGFEKEQSFILMDDPKVAPFQWLQSEEESDVAFLIIPPTTIRPQYQLKAERNSLTDLQLDDGNQTAIYVIATLNGKPQDTTLNFKGPLVFNQSKQLIQQVVDEKEDLKAPLFS